MMTIAQIMEKMIAFSEGNIHDITHLSCVWTYAKTIGELEGLDAETQFILEVAAITHDIACPLCRKKYGNTNGSYQEQEGDPLVRAFLADTGMTAAQIDRVAYLVGHHHSPEQINKLRSIYRGIGYGDPVVTKGLNVGDVVVTEGVGTQVKEGTVIQPKSAAAAKAAAAAAKK